MESQEATARIESRLVHPKIKNTFISNIFYCWTFPIFRKGLKKTINEDDLYQVLKEHECNSLANKLESTLKKDRHKRLWRALFVVFKWDLLVLALYTILIDFILLLISPIALAELMRAYDSTNETSNEAKLVNGAIIVVNSFVRTIVVHKYVITFQQLGLKVRIACSSLIYRKCLRLNRTSLNSTTIGHIINLLTNDIAKLVTLAQDLHVLWAAPLEFFLVLYLLYFFAGIQGIGGIAFILLILPIQLYISKRSAYYRLRIALRTDERIKFMSEIISGIQVIKMYSWENPFIKLIDNIRRKEIVEIKFANYLEAIMTAFAYFIDRGGIFLAILATVLTGNSPNAHYVFVVTALYTYLMDQVSYPFPETVSLAFQSRVSIKRFESFLKLEEIQAGVKTTRNIGIRTIQASAKWLHNSKHNDLVNIDFESIPNGLVAIIGPIGSGKSSLLHLFLNELTISGGIVQVGGKISYASQEPWLFSGTIRQNILFGEEFVLEKYQKVVQVCALESDLQLFPYGDQTRVGERGVLLSGGQKARINLARAVYKDADIYLLDDPLSAVDASVGKQIFKDCICSYLKSKHTVLVTHQIQYLALASCIYLVEDGKISMSGTNKELRESAFNFSKLLKAEEDLEEQHKDEIQDEIVVKQDSNEQEEEEETGTTGTISAGVYKSYFQSGKSWMILAFIPISCFLTEFFGTGTDYFLVSWVNTEQNRTENTTLNHETYSREMHIYVYTALIASLIICVLMRSLIWMKACMNSSISLHNEMFTTVVNATIKFFHNNPSGRILNRFSKDIGIVDDSLPHLSLNTIQCFCSVAGTIIVICVVNPWIIIPSGLILIVMYFVKNIFLSSSRNIKRMEGKTRSPIFGHITETMKGLGTIRALGAESLARHEFENHQNTNSSAYYMFLGCNRSFAFWLDLICNVYGALAITIALISEKYGGNVGFIIVESMNLTGLFQWSIRQWGELENQMTSVERVKEYADLEREADLGKSTEASKNWPEKGAIAFKSVSLKYNPDQDYVLKDLNFSIAPREKIGIVGRTGAGKSSLLSVLFRLVSFEGDVIIDNVNTKELSLSQLRSKLGIIPQEPVLFSATIRKNLDPFEQFSDVDIWNVLQEVELKQFVSNLPSGIFSTLAETGSNLSAGQKQLLCLARALLKKNTILIMDEATANVDPHTDELLQKTIRRSFAHCTVLTIAHRLHTIMDSDQVLVMSEGKVVEFDHPYNLLMGKGVFYDLVIETGKGTADDLIEISRMNYEQSRRIDY